MKEKTHGQVFIKDKRAGRIYNSLNTFITMAKKKKAKKAKKRL